MSSVYRKLRFISSQVIILVTRSKLTRFGSSESFRTLWMLWSFSEACWVSKCREEKLKVSECYYLKLTTSLNFTEGTKPWNWEVINCGWVHGSYMTDATVSTCPSSSSSSSSSTLCLFLVCFQLRWQKLHMKTASVNSTHLLLYAE